MSLKSSSFPALILSNGSPEYYSSNTLSKFSVKFPFSLELPTNANEKYCIALNSILMSSKYEPVYKKDFDYPAIIQIQSLPSNLFIETDNNNNISIYPKPDLNTLNKTKNKVNYLKDGILSWASKNLYYETHFTKDGRLLDYYQIRYYFTAFDSNSKAELFFLQEAIDKTPGIDATKGTVGSYRLGVKTTNREEGIKERVFFLRSDIAEKSLLLTNKYHPIDNINTYQRPANLISKSEKLFKDILSARALEKSEVTFNSCKYTILVLYEECDRFFIDLPVTPISTYMPKIIKIKCMNIREQIYNNVYCNDLAIFNPTYKNKQSHYFYEFKKPALIPLLSTTLSDIHFIITDEHDEQLFLSKAMATVLNTTFKTMPFYYKSFYARLTPELSAKSNNSLSQFKNILNSTLTFNSRWYVGLKSILFPNNFKIFHEDGIINIIKIDYYTFLPIPNEEYKIIITNQKFNKPLDFINFLNDKVSSYNLIYFELGDTDNLIRIKTYAPVNVELSRCIANIFQLPMSSTDKYFKFTLKTASSKLTTSIPISFNYYRPSYLMIYNDIIEQSVISGIFAQILTTVCVDDKSSEEEFQYKEFESITYHRIDKLIIPEINTEIRDPSGKLVQFNNDKLLMELHFTNYIKENEYF